MAKSTKPKPRRTHNVSDYKKAIAASKGMQSDIAKRLKITRGAVTLFLINHPELREDINQKRESWIDEAEDEMFSQLRYNDYDKDPTTAARIRHNASKFILERLGKDRGFTEKTESSVEHKGEQIKIIIEEKIPEGGKNDKLKQIS